MRILVSAIIPVYNAEKFLVECIESLRNQTLSEIEMIFINDGSTDNSLEILERYKKIDNRITVINQKNSGPSVARNKGIKIAKGEYISFIDSDDWINKNMYQEMYQNAKQNNSDLVICDMKLIGKNDELYIKGTTLNTCIYDKEKVEQHIYEELISNSQFNSAANKLYKAEIVKSHHITFDKEIYYAEDWLFNVNFLKRCTTVSYINKAFYYYRRGHESSSSTYKDDTFYRTGTWLYNMRKQLAYEFNINPFLAIQDLYKVLVHCIISEFRRQDINFYEKKRRVNNILRVSEVEDIRKNINVKQLTKKDFFLLHCIKYKLSIFLYLYVLLGKVKDGSISIFGIKKVKFLSTLSCKLFTLFRC